MSDDKKFDPTMADRLEGPGRKDDMPPDALVGLVEPFEGMFFADVGCGSGYCFFPIVEAAQGIGLFYAVDSQQAMLDNFTEKLAERGLDTGSIQTLLTPDDSLAFPDGHLDRALLCFVYHELPDRPAYMQELLRVLKPGGRLIVVDWPPLAPGEERVQGPPADHRISIEQASGELSESGFGQVNSVEAFENLWTLVAVKES